MSVHFDEICSILFTLLTAVVSDLSLRVHFGISKSVCQPVGQPVSQKVLLIPSLDDCKM